MNSETLERIKATGALRELAAKATEKLDAIKYVLKDAPYIPDENFASALHYLDEAGAFLQAYRQVVAPTSDGLICQPEPPIS